MAIDTERNRLLIEAYLSGQISDAAWQEHLREEPGLWDQWFGSDPMAMAQLRQELDRRDLLAAQGRWPSWRALIEDLAIFALMLIGALTVVAFALWALGVPQWMGLL